MKHVFILLFMQSESESYQVDHYHRHLQATCSTGNVIECENGYVNGSAQTAENSCTFACGGYQLDGTRKVNQGGCCIRDETSSIILGAQYSDPCYQLTAHICNEPAGPNCAGEDGKLL